MPIYEFRCGACGHEFERWQKISEPDPERCPECGAAKLVRVISPVGFRLKGGGWYETDFKKSGRRNVVEADKDGGAKKEKSDASAGDKAKPKEASEKTESAKKTAPEKKADGQALA